MLCRRQKARRHCDSIALLCVMQCVAVCCNASSLYTVYVHKCHTQKHAQTEAHIVTYFYKY